MKLLISTLLYFFIFSAASATGHYKYQDNCVKIDLEWNENHNRDSEQITIKVISLTDILIPYEGGCFDYDSTDVIGFFRNYGCDFTLTEHNYGYFYCKKDSLQTYTWKINRLKGMKAFGLDIIYIPTTSNEYISRKKRIALHKNNNGKDVYEVLMEDNILMINHAKLTIEP